MATIATLIVNVAANTAQLTKDVQGIHGQLDGVESAAKKFGAALGAALSLNNITAAAERVGQTASRIQDLAVKTGISAEAVQRLDFVAKQTGSSFDLMAKGIAQMSNRLVEGDKSAVGSIAAMGLSVEKLRAMSPDQAFVTIAAAIQKIPDPMMQTKVAMDLFGRAGAELLPVIKSGITDIAAQAPVMANAMVGAGDRFDDELVKLRMSMTILQTQALLPLMNAFLAMPQWVQIGGMAFMQLQPLISSFALLLMSLGGPTGVIGLMTTAWGALAGFLTTTIIPLFTAALPMALRGLAVLLTPPTGFVIAGILAVVAIWRNWDSIATIVQNVYNAVKLWMVDKFTAIVESIRQKVDSVTGFFRGMYDKVVGHSYVPDMIRQIGVEFSKLNQTMVNPAQAATMSVDRVFSDMLQKVSSKLSGFLTGFLPKWGAGMQGGFGHIAQTSVGILSSLLTGGVSSALNAVAGLAMKGLAKIGSMIGGFFKKMFGGGEHGTVVNPMRDDWFGGRSVQDIGDQLAPHMDGEQARQMIEAVFNAKTKSDFEKSSGAIDKVLSGGMGIMAGDRVSLPDVTWGGAMAGGGSGRVSRPTMFLAGERGSEDFAFSGGGKSFGGGGELLQQLIAEVRALRGELGRPNVSIDATDVKSFEDMLLKRGIPFISRAVRDNNNRARTELSEALGLT
jgi:hypothetical protein